MITVTIIIIIIIFLIIIIGSDFITMLKKVKVAHTRLPSIGFQSWSWFLAVSLQVTWVINPAVGYRYFLPGLQSSPQPLRGLLPVLLLGEHRHNLSKSVTRQRRVCDLNPGLLGLSPAR